MKKFHGEVDEVSYPKNPETIAFQQNNSSTPYRELLKNMLVKTQ